MAVTGDLKIILMNVDAPQAGGSVPLIFSRFLIGVAGIRVRRLSNIGGRS
jgi:hypothetical protein